MQDVPSYAVALCFPLMVSDVRVMARYVSTNKRVTDARGEQLGRTVKTVVSATRPQRHGQCVPHDAVFGKIFRSF